MNKKKDKIKHIILWYLATILEWVIVPIYLAAMGYEFNIPIYEKLRDWQYITSLYYLLASIDIILFGYFVIIYRKREDLKSMGVSVFCCLTQIMLLISKIKI